ncbi:MAG: hypothetical protein ACE5IO_00675 [Thermoplasmata archaeon]
MSVRLIWRTEFGEMLDRILLLGGEKGVLVSTGQKTHFLDEAGLQSWTVTLEGRAVGFGFSAHENVFFIAHENGVRLVNRIGVTTKRVSLESPPVGFVVSEIVAVLTEGEVLAFSREGRELWKSESGGSDLTSFRGRIFVGNGKKLAGFSRSGRKIAERDVPERIVALSAGKDSLLVALPHKILFMTEDCETSDQKSLDDTVLGLSADEFIAVQYRSKVALCDRNGEERWLLPIEASSVSSMGKGVAVAAGWDLLYYEEVGEKDVLYEVMCRGESRCGSFVSSSYLRRCPKCRSGRITTRIIKKEIY